jgi:hypothetical protein
VHVQRNCQRRAVARAADEPLSAEHGPHRLEVMRQRCPRLAVRDLPRQQAALCVEHEHGNLPVLGDPHSPLLQQRLRRGTLQILGRRHRAPDRQIRPVRPQRRLRAAVHHRDDGDGGQRGNARERRREPPAHAETAGLRHVIHLRGRIGGHSNLKKS